MTPVAVAKTYNELMGPESRVKSIEIQDDGHRQTLYVKMTPIHRDNSLSSIDIALNVPEK